MHNGKVAQTQTMSTETLQKGRLPRPANTTITMFKRWAVLESSDLESDTCPLHPQPTEIGSSVFRRSLNS